MPKLTVNFPQDISDLIDLHKARYKLYDKREAVIDLLHRFFLANQDYDYFIKANSKIKAPTKKKVELDIGRKVQGGK